MSTFLDALPSILLGLVIFFGRRQLKEIHVLVNSRLSQALEEIKWLKDRLSKAEEEDQP